MRAADLRLGRNGADDGEGLGGVLRGVAVHIGDPEKEAYLMGRRADGAVGELAVIHTVGPDSDKVLVKVGLVQDRHGGDVLLVGLLGIPFEVENVVAGAVLSMVTVVSLKLVPPSLSVKRKRRVHLPECMGVRSHVPV